jgi:hypothetical protein
MPRHNKALYSARCVSWRAEERPGLGSQVLPELSRLAGAAEALAAATVASATTVQDKPPSMLLCPITQDVFDDPVIAADGHTCAGRTLHLTTSFFRHLVPALQMCSYHC